MDGVVSDLVLLLRKVKQGGLFMRLSHLKRLFDTIRQMLPKVEPPVTEKVQKSLSIMNTISVTGSNRAASHYQAKPLCDTKACDLGGPPNTRDKVYMPFDGDVVAVENDGKDNRVTNTVMVVSTNPVEIPLIEYGKYVIDYLTLRVTHDNTINPNVFVGAKLKQGEYFYDEGTKGNVPEHVHVVFARGKPIGKGYIDLQNVKNKPIYRTAHTTGGLLEIYEAMFLKPDTVIRKQNNPGDFYPWIRLTEGEL